MTDYVQYHNPAKNPPLSHEEGYFGIYTRKSVQSVSIGDRVWVITSSGPPRKYFLVEWFTVDDIEVNMPLEENIVSGGKGRYFRRLTRLDHEVWFPAFLRNQGNFGRGFSPITDREFIRGLEIAAGIGARIRERQRRGDGESASTTS